MHIAGQEEGCARKEAHTRKEGDPRFQEGDSGGSQEGRDACARAGAGSQEGDFGGDQKGEI